MVTVLGCAAVLVIAHDAGAQILPEQPISAAGGHIVLAQRCRRRSRLKIPASSTTSVTNSARCAICVSVSDGDSAPPITCRCSRRCVSIRPRARGLRVASACGHGRRAASTSRWAACRRPWRDVADCVRQHESADGQPLAYRYHVDQPDALPGTPDDSAARARLAVAIPVGNNVDGPGLPLVNTSRWIRACRCMARWHDRVDRRGNRRSPRSHGSGTTTAAARWRAAPCCGRPPR